MILKISLRAITGVPKTLVKRNLRLHTSYFLENTLMLTESREEFSDLHFFLKASCALLLQVSQRVLTKLSSFTQLVS